MLTFVGAERRDDMVELPRLLPATHFADCRLIVTVPSHYHAALARRGAAPLAPGALLRGIAWRDACCARVAARTLLSGYNRQHRAQWLRHW